MSKALLINFTIWHVDLLTQEGTESTNVLTIWNTGKQVDIIPSNDINFVFVDADFKDDMSTSLHAGNYKYFEKYVEEGGIVVTFLGNAKHFHLANLIGLPEKVHVKGAGGNMRSVVTSQSEFLPIFATYGNKISSSQTLINNLCVITSTEKINIHPSHGSLPDTFEILAYQGDIQGVVALKYQLGKGFYLFLPSFGNENMDVMKLLIQDIFPNKFPELFEQPMESWTAQAEYQLPEVINVLSKIEELDQKYVAQSNTLKEKYKKVMQEKQEPYLKLITEQSDELKNAVALFFRELGYHVVDVDNYFKEKGIEKPLDEDLWVMNAKIDDLEEIMQQEDLKIVEVKGIRGTPSDDDVTAVTKYVRKRVRETKNSQIRGVFVVNHLMSTPANNRRAAFRDMLVKNAEDAGELLIATNTLYKFVKAIKNAEIDPKQVKDLIDNTAGELIFKIEESVPTVEEKVD